MAKKIGYDAKELDPSLNHLFLGWDVVRLNHLN